VTDKLVFVDLDGTLADGTHRLHHIHPKKTRNWDLFYEKVLEDAPHQDIIDMVNILVANYTVILLTGRREETRKDTEQWLRHFSVRYHGLIMRPEGNKTDDHIWKPEVLRQFGLHNIAFVMEDRNRIVKTLREMGLRVLHVAEGDF
jgi:trehalose-6-phosphatase